MPMVPSSQVDHMIEEEVGGFQDVGHIGIGQEYTGTQPV